MSSGLGKALKELGNSMKLMVYPSASAVHMKNCKKAVDEFNTSLKVSLVAQRDNILQAIPVIAATSILVDIIKCVEIQESFEQACFKKWEPDDDENAHSIDNKQVNTVL
ncbi:hypothetical protein Hanom_Chr06g00479281 [Helianthus anomalus]